MPVGDVQSRPDEENRDMEVDDHNELDESSNFSPVKNTVETNNQGRSQ